MTGPPTSSANPQFLRVAEVRLTFAQIFSELVLVDLQQADLVFQAGGGCEYIVLDIRSGGRTILKADPGSPGVLTVVQVRD